jgi:hemoglobin-like flavoprotein
MRKSTGEKSMTEEDVHLVQQSWEKIEFVKEVAAELFFARLFELDPPLRSSFPPEARERQQKFGQFVGATVRGLNRLDALRPVVRELGIRHPVFGDDDLHHSNLASALLWALEKSLRREFTPQVKSAWIKTYGVLSQTMRDAAAAPRAA